jgi:hypothetical protein
MSTRRRLAGAGPGAIELIEESVQLLRGASPGTFAIYYAGSAPFVLGILFFWAYMSWFTPPPAANAWAACGLVALFAAMKTAHAEFCARLMAQRMGAPMPRWSWGRLCRLACTQMRIQAWGLILLPLALVISLPFGWVYAYFQNISVLGDTERIGEVAYDQMLLRPGQNHISLLVIFFLFSTAWINLAAFFRFLPWTASHLLGIENVFGLSGPWWLNSTFLASVTCMAWLVADPLVKAYYTLRVFYGRARVTGEDLRVDLGRSAVATGRVLALFALLIALGHAAPAARAEELPRAEAAANPRALDASIDEVLSGRDFEWRMRPPARPSDEENDGPVKHFVRQGMNIVKSMATSAWRLGRRFFNWLDRLIPRGSDAKEGAGLSIGAGILRFLLYTFAIVAIALIGVVVFLAVRGGSALVLGAKTPVEAAPTVPNLADEGSHAGQLAMDGWLELARQQLGLGEYRLVWRALYLATLARLASDGLISLAKFKTNGDYEVEVRRRAMDRTEVFTRFADRRRAFEAVWYGATEPSESAARDWLLDLEGTGSK